MTETTADLTFEQQLDAIDAIVTELESGDITLDAMLDRYASGMELIAACQQRLAEAELRVSEIATRVEQQAMPWDDLSDDDDDV